MCPTSENRAACFISCFMWLYLHCVPKASSCAKLNLSHLNLVESRVCGPFIGRTAGAPLTHLCTSHVWKQDLFYGCRGGLERFPSAGVASRKLQRRRVHVSKLNSSRSPHSENDGKNILIRFLAEKQCFNVTLRFQRGGWGLMPDSSVMLCHFEDCHIS